MARPSTSLPALRSVIRGTSDQHGLSQRVVTVMGEGEEHASGALGQGDGEAPTMILYGRCRAIALAKGAGRVLLSLTHDGDYALAQAMLVGGPPDDATERG